jgi:hypothetical protein
MDDHARLGELAEEEPPGKGSVDWHDVFVGAVLGFLLTWVAPFLAANLLGVTTRQQEITVGVSAILFVPIASFLLLLSSVARGSRRARAKSIGFLIGVTIGSVVGAATCIPFWMEPSW